MKSSRVACLLDAESGPGAALESKQAIVAIVQKMDNTEKNVHPISIPAGRKVIKSGLESIRVKSTTFDFINNVNA